LLQVVNSRSVSCAPLLCQQRGTVLRETLNKCKDMLEAITWKQYLSCLAAGVSVYYLVIGIYFNKQKIARLLTGRTGQHKGSLAELEELVTEIRHSIFEEAGKEITKEELLSRLAGRVVHYDGLRSPALRYALNNNLIAGAEELCGVTFSARELDEVWERLPR